MRRHLFVDGINSITHALFGIATYWAIWLCPAFIIYEILDHDDINLSVDLAEYIIALMATLTLLSKSWWIAILSLAVTVAFTYHFSDTITTGKKTWLEILFNK